jgi:soluble lytic murein transglycosylase
LRAAQRCASNPLVRDTLTWRLAIGDREASFAELDAALTALADWPQLDAIRSRAEAALAAAAMTPDAKLSWLSRQPNLSADSQALRAVLLAQSGRSAEAVALAKATFANEGLGASAEDSLWSQFSTALSPADIGPRVAALQWRGEHMRARRYFPSLSAEDRAVAEAWSAINLARDATAFGQLAPSLQGRIEILFAETQRLRRAGQDLAAARLAVRMDARTAPLSARAAIFTERRRYVGPLIAASDAKGAYALVAESGLERGEIYADAEWLAGWIALRRLDDAGLAQAHFNRLAERVSTPVSVARATFWLGQSQRKLGLDNEASVSFARAAALPPTFFGQLATAQSAETARAPVRDRVPTAADRTRFDAMAFARALRWMGEAGDRRGFESMALHIANRLEQAADYTLLAETARSAGQPGTAVRAAKVGIRRGLLSLDAAYPVAVLPSRAVLNGPERGLTLAIIRQESEWDPAVVSPAGARGLMQLMPGTAQLVAKQQGLPYRLASLTTDTSYNVTLGAAYLKQLVSQFDGSYVLAIAAYNAGPARVRTWIAAYGDPRARDVDTIDWIESIPFAETRNYVQRVLENLQIYRQRLDDPSSLPALADDLERGARPA